MLRNYALVFYMLSECHYFETNEFFHENLFESSRFYREGNSSQILCIYSQNKLFSGYSHSALSSLKARLKWQ